MGQRHKWQESFPQSSPENHCPGPPASRHSLCQTNQAHHRARQETPRGLSSATTRCPLCMHLLATPKKQ